MENKLQVGFSRLDITPPMGVPVIGYFKVRIADGVLDNLEVNAIALRHGKDTVLLLSVDNCAINREKADEFKKAISDKTGVPTDAIFIHATHTHTGPGFTLAGGDDEEGKKKVIAYNEFMLSRCVDASVFAIEDLKPAKMGYAVGTAPDIAFIRQIGRAHV